MRIALASFIEQSTSTGMGRWTERIADKLRARGHGVEELDVTTLRLKSASALQRHLFGALIARLLVGRRRDLDVLIVHEAHALPACLIRGFTGTAVVVMSHGVENRIVHDLRRATRQGAAELSWVRFMKHQALWGWRQTLGFIAADQVLCLAEVDRNYLVSHLGIDPNCVTTFVNGADTVTAPLDAGAAAGVLSLGTWIPEKGSMLLPKIWRDVRSALPWARLTVAGAGLEPRQVLDAFSPDDRDTIRVVRAFNGTDELRSLLRSAGLFLMPSLREGSPLALLEAMSHGLPAVASRVGGIPEIVTDGKEGYLYSPLDIGKGAQHVRNLLENVELRRRMGSAAHVRAGACTWDAAAAAVERACKRAVEVVV
jgi:glycosyltransferase involved in cell wall biosynthesis